MMKKFIARLLIAALLIPSLSWGAGINLQTQIQGVLPIVNGGTGNTTATVANATTATNIAGGLNGSLPYQFSVGATAMLAVGTNHQVLYTDGVTPLWSNAVLSSGSNSYNVNTALTTADVGRSFYVTSGATITLPVLSTVVEGGTISLIGIGSPVIINEAAGDTNGIYALGLEAVSSVTLGTGASLILAKLGGFWVQIVGPGGLGYGQSWQAVTRASGTTYTNTTGNPIEIEFVWVPGGSTSTMNITIGGITRTLNVNATSTMSSTYIIPIGNTYSYTVSGGTSVSGINELR